MRIGFINDFRVAGGAEITSVHLINLMKERGISVEFITAGEKIPLGLDGYIINNFRRRDIGSLQSFIKTISDNQKIIYMPRDILPMVPEHESFVDEIVCRANSIFFLSGIHRNAFEIKYGLGVPDSKLYIPYFNVGDYGGTVEERQEKICWVGFFYKHKGIDNVLNFARANKCKIDFYGSGDEILEAQLIHSRYAELKPKGAFHKNIYSGYKYFIHLPSEVEVFGRSVAEAFLCGCQCILDESKIGFSSYGFNSRESFEMEMIKSQNEFISEVLK